MSSDRQHSPQHQDVLKKQALEQSEVKEVMEFIKKYAIPTAIVILVVCGIFLFDRYLKASKTAKAVKADFALMNAMGAADYEEIIEDYGSTASAPMAMMSLALTLFGEGNYAEARDLYAEFGKQYGKHPMAQQAELNEITCREALGELSEAHLLYGEFAAAYQESYLAPVALMGRARCLEAMGNDAEAIRAYEDLIVAYPGSGWADLADTRMTVLGSTIR